MVSTGLYCTRLYNICTAYVCVCSYWRSYSNTVYSAHYSNKRNAQFSAEYFLGHFLIPDYLYRTPYRTRYFVQVLYIFTFEKKGHSEEVTQIPGIWVTRKMTFFRVTFLGPTGFRGTSGSGKTNQPWPTRISRRNPSEFRVTKTNSSHNRSLIVGNTSQYSTEGTCANVCWVEVPMLATHRHGNVKACRRERRN